MLKIIKTRLRGAKGVWPKELPSILWAYRMMARTLTRETPFQLAYESKTIIPAKDGLTSYRVSNHNDGKNDEAMCL